MGRWGPGGRRGVWKDPERSPYFWLPGQPFQSHAWWPDPALPASPGPPQSHPEVKAPAGSTPQGPAHSLLQPHSSFKTQPRATSSWNLDIFSKLESSPRGIAPGSSLVPFCRGFDSTWISVPVSCSVLPGRWKIPEGRGWCKARQVGGWGLVVMRLPSGGSWGEALNLSALA